MCLFNLGIVSPSLGIGIPDPSTLLPILPPLPTSIGISLNLNLVATPAIPTLPGLPDPSLKLPILPPLPTSIGISVNLNLVPTPDISELPGPPSINFPDLEPPIPTCPID